MFKVMKKYPLLLYGMVAIILFASVDYNLFGLFGGFGWAAVLLAFFSYLFVFSFLIYFLYFVIKLVFTRKTPTKSAWLQCVLVVIFSFVTFIWLDNRGVYPNSGYSEEFYK